MSTATRMCHWLPCRHATHPVWRSCSRTSSSRPTHSAPSQRHPRPTPYSPRLPPAVLPRSLASLGGSDNAHRAPSHQMVRPDRLNPHPLFKAGPSVRCPPPTNPFFPTTVSRCPPYFFPSRPPLATSHLTASFLSCAGTGAPP
jgi:hypothetical protein